MLLIQNNNRGLYAQVAKRVCGGVVVGADRLRRYRGAVFQFFFQFEFGFDQFLVQLKLIIEFKLFLKLIVQFLFESVLTVAAAALALGPPPLLAALDAPPGEG